MTNCDQNLIFPIDDQNKSACQMSDHSFDAFSAKCFQISNLQSEILPKLVKSADCNPDLISFGGSQEFQAIHY